MARLIDADNLLEEMQFRVDVKGVVGETIKDMAAIVRKLIAATPTVDAVKLPEGKPGDYLEWDCGTGWTTVYFIYSVNIYPGGEMRYCLGNFEPVVEHKNIRRIMSRDEAQKELERRAWS